MSRDVADLDEAYRVCARLARARSENFPVASRLLPGAMRRHIAAIYAFARTADDFADEGERTPQERWRLLDAWHARLRALGGGDAAARAPLVAALPPHEGRGPEAEARALSATVPEADAIFAALAATIEACRLPLRLFEDLLSAFRQDVAVCRYETWEALLDYCRRSADPVGRLVLRVAGYDDPALDRASDALCTALQLTNFWQDLARDWRRGRLYVPAEERRAAGAAEADLHRGLVSPAWQAALARAAARTRTFFARGRRLGESVRGRLGVELRLTWLGGMTVLERLEQARFDVFGRRPVLTMGDGARLLWRATVGWRWAERGDAGD